MRLKVKVGQKGQVLIPKLLREKYGIRENERVTIEAKEDGLVVRGRPPIEETVSSLQTHLNKLRAAGVGGSKLGDLKGVHQEMEYEVKAS